MAAALLDSALINEQLVPIYPSSVMNPLSTPARNMGAGAGTTTLAGNYMGGSAVKNTASPQTAAPIGTAMQSVTNAASSVGSILGIPAVAFWVLVFAVIGYVVLKVVHFHSVVEADTNV